MDARGEANAGRRDERLCVFAKWPTPGRAKTRLARSIGERAAAECSEAMMRDAFAAAEACCRERGATFEVWFSPGDEATRARFAEAAPTAELLPQPEGDLGVRLKTCIERAFGTGADAAVLTGTDAPRMTPGEIGEAFEELRGSEAVIVPTADGGYSLLGLGRSLPVFEGIDWSTSRVFGQTVRRLGEAEVSPAVRGLSVDVDTVDDLEAVAGLLMSDPPEVASRLRRFLEGWGGGCEAGAR